ncbi:MAG: hypothetical protein OHK005_10840 [Candidatus Methylacidiphilales bacterium]
MTVEAGRLLLRNGGNLAGTSGITVDSGAQLRFQDTNQLGTGTISLAGTGDGSNGALRLQSGMQTLANSIVLNSAATGIHTEGGGSQLTLTGAISGLGGLQKTGGGTLILDGPTTFTGNTNINAGTLRLNNVNALASSSQVNISSTLQLNVSGASSWQLGTGPIIMLGGTLRQLSGTETDIATISQNIVLQNPGQTSTLNAPGDSRIYVTGDITGPGNLNKAGGGELRFEGQDKSYTGTTTVSNGRLRIDSDGIPTGTSAINLAGGNLRFGQKGTRTFSLGAGGSGPITFTAPGSSIEKTDTGSTTLTNPLIVNAPGNIRNREAGSTFTLTGPLTGAGDLTFNVGSGGNPIQAGTIVLAGDASAFSGNVTLQQGTLRLGPNTVLGANNFIVNPNSTLGITIGSPTAFGQVNATGTATLNGPVTIQPLFTGSLTEGLNSLDIVTAAGGLTVSGGLSVASESPLLILSLNQLPNKLQLVLNVDYTGAASGLSLNRNQSAVARFIGSGTGNPNFDQLRATALNQQGEEAIRDFYDSVGAEELGALSDMAFATGHGQLRNVMRRAQGLQTQGGLGMTGVALRPQMERGGGDDWLARKNLRASGMAQREDDPRKRWGVFADLNGQRQVQDRTASIGGYETSTQGFTVGADRFLTDKLVLGGYAGYDRSRTQFDRQRGWITADSATVGSYLGWLEENWHVTGAIQYNRHEYDMERYSLLGTAKGKTGGDQISSMVAGGYDFKRGRWTFGPTGSLTYSKLWVDGFSENGSPIAQKFSQQEADSLQLGLGGKVSYLFPGNFVSIRPELRAEYRREFMDSARSIDSTLIGGGPALQLETAPPSKDFAVLGGGLNAEFSDSTTAFVNYEAEVGRSNYIAHGVYGGVRWNFPGGPIRSPVILLEDEPKDWRNILWDNPVGQSLRWINLRGILHAQYDYIETNSKAGTIDPADPDMESVLFIRRLRLSAERELGAGFFIEGAGEYDEHAQGRPPLKLFNANVGWRPIEEFHLLFGFDKVPFSHEETISSSRLKTVERSVASRTFTKLGDLGEQHVRLAVEGRFKDVLDGEWGILNRYDLHYEAALAHPSEDASALWDDDPAGTRSSMPAPSYYFRLAHELRTKWGDFDVGADFAYAPSFRARGSNQPTGAYAVSPFFNYNKGWFNLRAQWMGLTYTRDDANGGTRRSPTGFTIEPSFYVHPKWEIVTMYSTFDTNGDEAIRFNQSVRNAPTFYPDDRRFDNIHQFYIGFNHYIKGNDIKLSTGIERIEADGARATRPVSGEDAWAVRARLQVLF